MWEAKYVFQDVGFDGWVLACVHPLPNGSRLSIFAIALKHPGSMSSNGVVTCFERPVCIVFCLSNYSILVIIPLLWISQFKRSLL